jgi:hypothetical protein
MSESTVIGGKPDSTLENVPELTGVVAGQRISVGLGVGVCKEMKLDKLRWVRPVPAIGAEGLQSIDLGQSSRGHLFF